MIEKLLNELKKGTTLDKVRTMKKHLLSKL